MQKDQRGLLLWGIVPDCTLGDVHLKTGGFDPNDESQCADGSPPSTEGSWEAGPWIDGAFKARPDHAGNCPAWRQVFSGDSAPDAVDRGKS